MKVQPEPATPPKTTPEKTPMDRTLDLARRLFAVPKSEIPAKRKRVKRKRH